MFRCGNQRVFHMKPAVVSSQVPCRMDVVRYTGFCSPVLYFTGVYVQRTSVCADSLDHIVTIDIKEVNPIIKRLIEQSLRIRQFVIP